ncbi:MAG: LysE family translocator, partial [Chromatiales bacterium]|nr:LysE family translocator [Chromatiales bacterium]
MESVISSLMPYLPELLSVTVIAIFMSISPGADFVMVTRNSIFYSRSAGLYSSLGVSCAIWIHVAYSIAGLAVIISKSVVLFSIIKYLGAAYLIYIGWKTFRSDSKIDIERPVTKHELS